MINVLLFAGAGIAGFLGYVSSRKGRFRYERSGFINSPAETIYPYLSSFKTGHLWNPFEQKDPQMKREFKGSDGQVGSMMEFEGNGQTGSGTLEILKLVPNHSVEVKLIMTKPIRAENIVRYELKPEAAGTRFTWSMEGDGGFMGKLVTLFIDCEKMVAGEFEKGIVQLKALVEGGQK